MVDFSIMSFSFYAHVVCVCVCASDDSGDFCDITEEMEKVFHHLNVSPNSQ